MFAEEVEEVFAEDYDDHTAEEAPVFSNSGPAPSKPSADSEDLPKEYIHEAPACPNIVNPYHQCTDYCRDKYGFKQFKPIASLDAKRAKMLDKYPLPPEWVEVGDPVT